MMAVRGATGVPGTDWSAWDWGLSAVGSGVLPWGGRSVGGGKVVGEVVVVG